MDKLEKCPFCDGIALRKSSTYCNGTAYAWVCCLKCGCSTPKIPISLDYSARDKADKLWNRRAREDVESDG